MERGEPTFIPEWLKRSGSSSASSSSLHSDDQGVSNSARNKLGDNELGRTSVLDRTTPYFRRNFSSNSGSRLRSYSSFGRNHNRDWDRDTYDFRAKEKSGNKYHDRDDFNSFSPRRPEKDGLRRSHSNLSIKQGESWSRKAVGEKNGHNNGSGTTAFERDFPSLGVEEKLIDSDVRRVRSPGLSSAIQSLPIGNSAGIGGDAWTSALAEVPVMVGSNGSNTFVQQPTNQATTIAATTSVTMGRNMAETLAQGPSSVHTAPQSSGTQRLEELAVKQSRQLIPMTPSLPKVLALNSSDKPKLKVGQSQLQSSHVTNQPTSLRPVSVKSDISKPSTVGKLHVLKPSRERNGTTPTSKETSSVTSGSKLPNSPLSVPLSVGSSTPLRNTSGSEAADRKPSVATLEKRPSPQAQSRNDFFNLMRKKSVARNSTPVAAKISSFNSTIDKPGEGVVEATSVVLRGGGDGDVAVDGSCRVENKVKLSCNGDVHVASEISIDDEKNRVCPDVILCSEEEEAKFLRSLGWEETTEEECLTEEEISSFYRDVSKYVNLKTASNFFKGTQLKSLLTLNIHMGKNGDISPGTKVDS